MIHWPLVVRTSSPSYTLRRLRPTADVHSASVDPVDGGDWISLGGVVVSAGSAIWAVVSARRASAAEAKADGYKAKAEEHARRATAAAEDAVVAQRQSADAAKRAADALERQNRIAEEQADLSEGVPWRIEHRSGSTYDLWNDTGPKFHIHVAGEGIQRPKDVERIDGRSSVDFMVLDSWSSGGDKVVVTWHRREDASDEPRRWSGNKPPKR